MMDSDGVQSEEYKYPLFEGTDISGIKIIEYNKDHNLKLNEEVLKKLLLHPKVKDRFVSVISVIGRYRQGKSLLLNFLLFYLEVKYGKKVNDHHWMKPEYGEIKGFHFKHGTERDTEGILMWPEIFLTTLEDGKEVAIILLDTQGAFDGQSSLGDSSTLFALSSVISSVQIYNLMRQIGADDLNYLEYFAGSSTLLGLSFCKFQKLLFLIRDWGFPYKYSHENGQEYLDDFLSNENFTQQTKDIVKNLKTMFEQLSCNLLPTPGKAVTENGTFKGDIKSLNDTGAYSFIEFIEKFAISILAPENMVLKKVQGEYITCGELFEQIKNCINIFGQGQFDQMKDSFFSLVRDEHFDRIIMKKCELFFEKASKLGILFNFEDIRDACFEIVAGFFKNLCQPYLISDQDFIKYSSNLKDKVDLLSHKLKEEHETAQKKQEQIVDELINTLRTSYEEKISETIFENDEDFDMKHEEEVETYNTNFDTAITEFLETITGGETYEEAKISAEDILEGLQNELWTEFLEKLSAMKSEHAQLLHNKWNKAIEESYNKMKAGNSTSFQKTLDENKAKFEAAVTKLSMEFNDKLSECYGQFGFLDTPASALIKYQDQHTKLREETQKKFDDIPADEGFEDIKRSKNKEVVKKWDETFFKYREQIEKTTQRNEIIKNGIARTAELATLIFSRGVVFIPRR